MFFLAAVVVFAAPVDQGPGRKGPEPRGPGEGPREAKGEPRESREGPKPRGGQGGPGRAQGGPYSSKEMDSLVCGHAL